MQKYLHKLVWFWLICLILFNVIPLGNSDSSLSSNRLFELRLDYIVHSVMMLGFAWLWLFSRVLGFQYFARGERLKYALIVVAAGVCLEYLQLLVPWRTFNPIDLYFNLIGAGLTLLCLW